MRWRRRRIRGFHDNGLDLVATPELNVGINSQQRHGREDDQQ